MTLSEYIRTFPRAERMALRKLIASRLCISEVYVRSMCNGIKKIPGKYAIPIEHITVGKVPRNVTAPELYPSEEDKD